MARVAVLVEAGPPIGVALAVLDVGARPMVAIEAVALELADLDVIVLEAFHPLKSIPGRLYHPRRWPKQGQALGL